MKTESKVGEGSENNQKEFMYEKDCEDGGVEKANEENKENEIV